MLQFKSKSYSKKEILYWINMRELNKVPSTKLLILYITDYSLCVYYN